MRKLLYILTLLFLSFTFNSMPPPGWYQQTLPVNDLINDIFFLDSLNGWVVTQGHTNNNDTGFILNTTNGGDNWSIQFAEPLNVQVILFTDESTGYAGGGSGSGTRYMYKTTNGGNNWTQIIGSFAVGSMVNDLSFLNSDTGWYCDDGLFEGGVYKTINGGTNWVQQLNESYWSLKLFFINKDTGWVGTDGNKLYRTTNGGTNWSLQYTSNYSISSLFFLNAYKGWINGGTGNGVLYTTDGGFTWTSSQGNVATGYDVKFINDSVGYSGMTFYKVAKSTDGGKIWGYQNIPIFTALSVSVLAGDTSLAWMGTNGFIHTTDGGGPIIFTGIKQISNNIPKDFELYQNYPNPFNPKTIIKFNIKITSDVSLKVYDLGGRLIDGIFYKNVHPGEYEYEFDGTGLTSGVYFYRLSADGNVVDTRKMVLIK